MSFQDYDAAGEAIALATARIRAELRLLWGQTVYDLTAQLQTGAQVAGDHLDADDLVELVFSTAAAVGVEIGYEWTARRRALAGAREALAMDWGGGADAEHSGAAFIVHEIVVADDLRGTADEALERIVLAAEAAPAGQILDLGIIVDAAAAQVAHEFGKAALTEGALSRAYEAARQVRRKRDHRDFADMVGGIARRGRAVPAEMAALAVVSRKLLEGTRPVVEPAAVAPLVVPQPVAETLERPTLDNPAMWLSGRTPWQAEDDADDAEEFTSAETLESLAFPPGLVGRLVQWMVDTAERPIPGLYLPAALCLVGAIAGRNFATERDARTNFYCTGLAPSGHGKNHALDRVNFLAERAGLADKFLGASRIMSASGLRRELQEFPARVCLIDEVGALMNQITDPRAGLHNQNLRYDLMEYFSRANGTFGGAAYANERPVRIQAPHLCIYGVSTPEAFWGALSSAGTLDGLLARMLVFNVDGEKPAKVVPPIGLRQVPTELVQSCRALADRKPQGGNLAGVASAPEPIIVPLDADARAALDAFEAYVDAQKARAAAPERPAMDRAVEHASKLALVVAVGCELAAPLITRAVMDWACRLAWHSIVTLINQSRDRIADNERARSVNDILRIIRDRGKDGISPGRLAGRYTKASRQQREEILRDLEQAGRIEMQRTPTAGRTRERYVFRR